MSVRIVNFFMMKLRSLLTYIRVKLDMSTHFAAKNMNIKIKTLSNNPRTN